MFVWIALLADPNKSMAPRHMLDMRFPRRCCGGLQDVPAVALQRLRPLLLRGRPLELKVSLSVDIPCLGGGIGRIGL